MPSGWLAPAATGSSVVASPGGAGVTSSAGSSDASDASDAASESGPGSGPGSFVMPFTLGGTAQVGVPLSQVTTVDLKKAMGWAMQNASHDAFIEAASKLLDDRRLGDAKEPVA